MVPALLVALTLVSADPSTPDADIRQRNVFAAQIRGIIERGDVEAFIVLLSPNGIRMGDTIVPTRRVVDDIRKKKGVYAELFDTAALQASAGSGGALEYPMLSYRDYFKRAKDAVAIVDLDFAMIRWSSESLRVALPPSFGIEKVGGRLRIGCFGDGCS
jgi:hypothetical protein